MVACHEVDPHFGDAESLGDGRRRLHAGQERGALDVYFIELHVALLKVILEVLAHQFGLPHATIAQDWILLCRPFRESFLVVLLDSRDDFRATHERIEALALQSIVLWNVCDLQICLLKIFASDLHFSFSLLSL